MIALLLLVLPAHLAQYAFPPSYGDCGDCPMPACQPRPVCPPPQIQYCPPPPPCPPQFCPPPPLCPPPTICPPPPPPPPPRPPPMCTCVRPVYIPMYSAYSSQESYQPPLTPGYSTGGYSQVQVPQGPLPIAQNDCCCGCSSPCRFRRRAAAFSSKTVDPSCNSESLRSIMQEFMTTDASKSKRAIQVAAEKKLKKSINVICGSGEFSYIAHTERFCQSSKLDITCYAFQPV